MHHVPIALRGPVGEQEYKEVIDYMVKRAEVAGVGEMLRAWIRDAEERCSA